MRMHFFIVGLQMGKGAARPWCADAREDGFD
jgi:hypothetical protein